MSEHWEPVIPYVYRRGALIERNSGDCGRWVNFDPSVDWICEDCNKYYKQKFEATQDGITWYDTGLRRKGNIYELESDECCLYRWITLPISQYYECDDCGDIPVGIKFVAEYGINGHIGTASAMCGSSSTLLQSDVATVKANGEYPSSFQIGNCVTSIGSGAFSNCGTVTAVTIPNSVTSIGSGAFSKCGIPFINIPSGVTSIEDVTFTDSSLIYITIPSGVTSIGWRAFDGSDYLLGIEMESTTPPSLGASAFTNTRNCPIFVPCQSIDTYKNNGSWYQYRDRITCKEQLNTLAYVTFDNGITIDYKSSGSTVSTVFNYIYPGEIVGVEITSACTSIGSNAFSGCSFSAIVIPDSVKEVGDEAFRHCSGLTSIYIPSGVTSINSLTFWGCRSLSSVTIPDGVTSIGQSAFEDCTSLSSITIPNSVETIEGSAFANCSLTSITIPNNTTSISKWAFDNCGDVSYITVGSSNTVYDSRDNCNAIIETSGNTLYIGCKNTIIPRSVTSIAENAFYGCEGLTSITIPSGVTSIGSQAFADCSGLTAIIFESPTPPYVDSTSLDCGNNCPIYIPCNSFSAYTSGYTWITSYYDRIREYPATGITITPTAMTLYDGASSYVHTDVTPYNACNMSVTLASNNPSVATVDDDGMVTALSVGTAKIIARNSNWIDTYCDVTVIPVHATGVTLSDSTLELSIGESYSLSATVLPSNATYKSVTWETNDSSIATIDNSGSISAVSSGDAVITVTTTDGGFTAKCDVTVDSEVGKKIYYTATEKLNVPVGRFTPNAVDEKYASSTSAGTIYFNEPVTAMYQSFNGSKKITSIIIPDSVTNIGSYTFEDCTNLTSCTIGSGVTQIGSSVFGGCVGLTSIDLPDGVTRIDDAAFRGCSGITSINIPSGVTYIRENIFNNCISLSSCTIPDGVTRIGDRAFSGCSSLTSITIPSGVTYIGYSAFQRCSSSTGDLDIPDNTTTIGYYAFWGCSGLTSVTIGSGITSIGQGAFYNCSGLESITINAITPPSFGSNVFINTNNCPIYVPAQSVRNYKNILSYYSSRIQAIQ